MTGTTTAADETAPIGVDELRARQLDRLRWTLRHAYRNVPFYRAKFDAAGVHPDDCRDLADLEKFPVTTKEDPVSYTHLTLPTNREV